MKNRVLILVLAVALGLVSTGCGASAAGENTLDVVLDWTPNTNHTGLYVAQELGYYEDAGLQVNVIQPPEDGALALVGAGKAVFGVDFQESLGPALTAENPLPVTAVAAIISHNTSGLITLKEDGIESPRDLAGKRFASWGTPLVDAIMRDVVEGDGGVFADVVMLQNTVTDVVSALQADIDAVWVYEAWDGVAVDQAGLATNYMAFADLNPVFDFYTPVLVANNAYLEKNPEQAKAFLAATAKGYTYAAEHPEEAARILLKYAPELSEDLVLASQEYLSDRYQADAPYWGFIDSGRWSAFYGWMYGQGLLERDLGAEGFSNDYLPGNA